MLKKINNFINILMGSFIGVFIGTAFFKYVDYQNHREVYATHSAPWYTGILLNGVVLATVLIICAVIKIIIKKR